MTRALEVFFAFVGVLIVSVVVGGFAAALCLLLLDYYVF